MHKIKNVSGRDVVTGLWGGSRLLLDGQVIEVDDATYDAHEWPESLYEEVKAAHTTKKREQ